MTAHGQLDLPHFDAERVRQVLPVTAAIEALDAAFGGPEPLETPVRSHYQAQGGELLLMPAWGRIGVGVKLVTLQEGNPDRGLPFIHGVFVLFAADGKQPVATMDGAALTAVRTAAVSALGTRYLARPDASRLLIFGAGAQAYAHLEALLTVRELRSATIVDVAPERAEALAARARELGLEARAGCADDVAGADLVCCCTTSRSPVFNGELLAPGTHIVAMGAYRPDMRELDTRTLQRARIVVESREAALAEAGDFIIPIADGEWDASGIDAELAEVVRGPAARRDPDEITVLKTVGLASEDLVVAHAAVVRAREQLLDGAG
jgi:ornithine cyclodeaminase/alanine dehydrogenase-like protein (mu-crystallin family)